MNSIKHHFDEKNKKFLQIWINAWETSLLSTPEESLIKIIHEIIDGLSKSDTDNDRKEKIKEGAKQILRGALRIGATATLGLKAGDVAEEMWKETENSIKTLREDLQEQVESLRTRSSNPYENVIYVDDLDRIVPKNAVAILSC